MTWRQPSKARSIIVGVMLAVVSISPVNAAQASVQYRMGLSVEIANYIRDVGKSNEFKTKFVDLGATAVEGNLALADWRSDDGRRHGQVSFVYLCDHWNVQKVKIGQPFRAQDFVGQYLGRASVKDVDKLIADLKLLEDQHIAYLKPARAERSC